MKNLSNKFYLDASVLLALVDDPTESEQKKYNRENTDKLWQLFIDNPEKFKIIISQTALDEVAEKLAKQNKPQKKEEQEKRLNEINYEIIPETYENEMEILAQKYIDQGIFSEDQDKDAKPFLLQSAKNPLFLFVGSTMFILLIHAASGTAGGLGIQETNLSG
jgi:hypothetical protein